jgi:osmotically-inducible protein OsmY
MRETKTANRPSKLPLFRENQPVADWHEMRSMKGGGEFRSPDEGLMKSERSHMKRINSVVAAFVLATTTVAGLTGCAGDRYHRSTGENIDDTATSARVKDTLGKDGVYRYPDVKVTTFKGTAQLSGFVETRDQKSRAGDLAKNTAGVHEVVNNITIKQ